MDVFAANISKEYGGIELKKSIQSAITEELSRGYIEVNIEASSINWPSNASINPYFGNRLAFPPPPSLPLGLTAIHFSIIY